MLLPSPGLEDSAHGSNSHISTIAGHSTASPEEKYRYTPDSAYDSAEDRCSQRKTTQVPYFTPPPETKGTSKPRKRKRMADDEINGSHSSAKHRRKILQSQIVFVDPQDASYAWWWPGVVSIVTWEEAFCACFSQLVTSVIRSSPSMRFQFSGKLSRARLLIQKRESVSSSTSKMHPSTFPLQLFKYWRIRMLMGSSSQQCGP